jgi:hypothetical protein
VYRPVQELLLSCKRRQKSKKFYHRIHAPLTFFAIWQRIQSAVRIRSRVSRIPIVPESPKRSVVRSLLPLSHDQPTEFGFQHTDRASSCSMVNPCLPLNDLKETKTFPKGMVCWIPTVHSAVSFWFETKQDPPLGPQAV